MFAVRYELILEIHLESVLVSKAAFCRVNQ